ncbi:MAG: SbcC/MukB-like Walker B domain-containing protein, partial [Bacilli bacterium]
PMQKNIEQYKILEIQAKELKDKVEVLAAIQADFDELTRYRRSMDMLTYVNSRVNYDENQHKLDNLNEKLRKNNERLMQIRYSIDEFDKQIENLNSDLASYQAKKLSSNTYSLTEKISGKKNELAQAISAITMSINSVMSSIVGYASEYNRSCMEFSRYYSRFDTSRLGDKLSKEFGELLDISNDLVSSSQEILSEIDNSNLDFENVKAFRNDMDSLRNQATTVKSLMINELSQTSDALQSLQSDLKAVNNGKKPFDKLGPNYIAIRNSLESSLRNRHSDAKVDIFCDLVDVNDAEWTMALEAVLYNQKFNFFVNPAYYEEANRILKELCDSYQYYRVSLVDTEKLLNANIMANDDSIANLIDTDDEGARAYADYILGRIKKCTTFAQARESGSGLLSDCTGYRGFATWYLNKANARVYFLGTKVSKDTQVLSASDYQKMNSRYTLLTEALNKIQPLLSLPIMSVAELSTYQADIGRSSEIQTLEDKIASLDQEMRQVSNGDMQAVSDKIESIKNDIALINQKREELLTERGSLLNDVQRLNAIEIPSLTATNEQFKNSLSQFDSAKVNEEYEPFYNKLCEQEGITIAQIRTTSQKEYIMADNHARSSRSNLLKRRNDYCVRFHLNYDIYNEAKNDEFKNELEKISTVLFPDYEEKIVSAHEDSIREFKDDFIYKLRTAIETVNAQIEELNQSLEDSRFGRDTYQFKVTPSKDFLEYYSMIMDPLLLKAGDAEALFMEKYKATMDNLFGLISSSTSSSGEEREQILKNINTFTDYTTYINFDLLVTRGIGDETTTISLGRSFKSQSGGETQTPFYIAILASFASLARVNNTKDNNTLRLVIFDEAFSKMDSARIMKS